MLTARSVAAAPSATSKVTACPSCMVLASMMDGVAEAVVFTMGEVSAAVPRYSAQLTAPVIRPPFRIKPADAAWFGPPSITTVPPLTVTDVT